MKARDVMVSPVITVRPSASVKEVAKIFLERRISAVPVVDDQGKIVGIVSEGDLLHRSEAGTQRQRPWWLLALTRDEALAADYVKAHARKVSDVMATEVITGSPEAAARDRFNARRLLDQTGPDREGRTARWNCEQSKSHPGGGQRSEDWNSNFPTRQSATSC